MKEKNEMNLETQKPKFSAWERKQTNGQIFGRPKLKKAGKEFDVHDFIQENREDTEIYPTLEKYGSLEKITINSEVLYGDMTRIKGLRDIHEQIEESQQLWDSLPFEIRHEFQGNKRLFMENGEKWLKEKIEKNQPKIEEKKDEKNA